MVIWLGHHFNCRPLLSRSSFSAIKVSLLGGYSRRHAQSLASQRQTAHTTPRSPAAGRAHANSSTSSKASIPLKVKASGTEIRGRVRSRASGRERRHSPRRVPFPPVRPRQCGGQLSSSLTHRIADRVGGHGKDSRPTVAAATDKAAMNGAQTPLFAKLSRVAGSVSGKPAWVMQHCIAEDGPRPSAGRR